MPGLLSTLTVTDLEDTVFSASDKVEKCPLCDAEPVISNQPAMQVTMYTQYQRATV